MSQAYRKRPRNPSPPSFAAKRHESDEQHQSSSRKIRNVTSNADHAELEKHYTFVPSNKKDNNTTWQDRMVSRYHSHLFKEYVLADMTRAPAMLGLRWRTREEVQNGRGHSTCGNKHCPGGKHILESSTATRILLSTYYESPQPITNAQEERLLEKVPHGVGLHDYEVPFTYTEQGETKTELVKLRLCLKCSPKLFEGGALKARQARSSKPDDNSDKDILASSSSDSGSAREIADKRTRKDSSDVSTDDERNRKHRRQKKRKKKSKRKRRNASED